MKFGYLIMLLTISSAYAQTEKITSRFYFPGLIGRDFQSNRPFIKYSRGIMLNTAIEYRPNDLDPWFYRFNYDGITNKYNSNAVDLPTNVSSGSLQRTYLVAGVGYRKKYKHIGWYAMVQPGLSTRNYNIVRKSDANYQLEQLTRENLSVKATGGFEYYLAPRFAIIMELAQYQNNFPHHHISFNNSATVISLGFTTTLF